MIFNKQIIINTKKKTPPKMCKMKKRSKWPVHTIELYKLTRDSKRKRWRFFVVVVVDVVVVVAAAVVGRVFFFFLGGGGRGGGGVCLFVCF